jgi:hypothetical protein
MPVERPRKMASALVVVMGLVLIALTFANNLFKVGPSFESLMTDFRPHLTSSAIASSRADLDTLGAAGNELQTKMVPVLAMQLGMTPDQFTAYVAQNYPQVSAGLQNLPQIVTTFDGLITTLDRQRPLFRAADAIPTKDLPATTVPWSLAGAGLLLVGVGGVMWFRPRLGAGLALGLGVLLIAVPAILYLPGKAADADSLNANLKPVYTAALVTQSKAALTTVSGMADEMQSKMLPALATQLKMTPAQLQELMASGFPATTAAMASLPTAMPRFQSMVTAFDENLSNYNTLKPVTFEPIIWTLMGIALLTALVGAGLLAWPRQRAVQI